MKVLDEKMPLSQVIARKLQERIRSGEWKPGDKIPPQRVLSMQLEVSRASLREALLTLETLGLVKTLPARGTFVANPDVNGGTPRAWRYDDAYSIHDVFQSRILIECEFCRLNAGTLEEVTLDSLESANDAFADAWKSGDLIAHVEADLRFHRTIADACSNLMLRRLYQSIQDLLTESQRQPIPHTEPARMAQSIAEHRDILHALRQSDSEQASRAMRTHIKNTANCAGVEFV